MESAALMSAYIVVWGMLTEYFGPSQGKTLYISGASGAVGTAVIQLAPLLGMRVIASASSEEKCAYLRSMNAAHVFQYTKEDPKDQIMTFTGGRGADIIMDQRVGPAFCEQLEYLADLGTILIYNDTEGDPGQGVIPSMIERFARCQSVRVFSFHYFDSRPELLAQKRKSVFEFLASGKVAPQIAARFSMGEIRQAHALLDSGRFCGGIVVQIP